MEKKYKKMISKMPADKSAQEWFLYMLRCNNGSLYTGVTNNLERRMKMHTEGKAAKYTRACRPVELVYREACSGRKEALMREWKVKELPKAEKEKLVRCKVNYH